MLGKKANKALCNTRLIVAALVSSVLLAVVAPVHAQPLIKVRFGVNNPYFPGNTPVSLGVKTGIFKKHGLDVEMVAVQSQMSPLLAGSTDITLTGSPPWLSAVAMGQKPIALATLLAKNSQAVMVKPDSPMAKLKGQWPEAIQALRGKKIGVTVAGAQVDLTTRYLLIQAGLDPDKDVQVLALGSGVPQVASLEQDRVDAIMAVVPFVQVLESSNRAVAIFDYSNLPKGVPAPVDQPYMLVVGNPAFVSQNPEVGPRVRAALKEVGAWIMNPANTAELKAELASGFGTSVASETIDGIIDQLRRGGMRSDYTCDDFANAVALMKSLKRLDRDDLKCSDYVLNP